MTDGQAEKETVLPERRGPVLVLWLDHPPANILSAAVRMALHAGLDAAADETCLAVVIAANGIHFSAGADVSAVVRPRVGEPDLASLLLRIEAFCKPVIAALHGNVLSGGLELAMAAHKRLATVSARLAMPDVKLGLSPGAGGTQRMPRLTGAAEALRLMQGGDAISATEAFAIGLVDQIVEDDMIAVAVDAASDLAATDWQRLRTSARQDGMHDPVAYQAAVVQARSRTGYLPAPDRIADCVEAALLLPMSQGLVFEQVAFDELRSSAQAQGLRHAFFAEQRALFPPQALTSVVPPRLETVAIWGTGGSASDVARQALAAGLQVTLVEPEKADLAAALKRIAARLEKDVTAGRQTSQARDADWARLKSSSALAGLEQADLLLHAIDAGPPRRLAAELPRIMLQTSGLAGGAGLQPGTDRGHLAELSAWPDAPVMTQVLGMTFARKLGWRLVFAGAGGQIEARLRAALSAAIAEYERTGVARPVIAGALASFGLGAAGRLRLPAMPAGGAEVLAGCQAVLAAQGARLLSESIALRPSDIDAVAVMAGLFPRWQGGPMFWADRRGALVLRAELRERAASAPHLFAPAPVFDKIIAEGLTFAALNRG